MNLKKVMQHSWLNSSNTTSNDLKVALSQACSAYNSRTVKC